MADLRDRDPRRAVVSFKRIDGDPLPWADMVQLSPTIMETELGQIPARFFTPELIVLYLLDHGDYFSWLSQADIVAAGMTEPQVFEIAVQNLMAIEPTIQIQDRGPIVTFQGNGNLESGVVLVDPLWEHMLAARFPNGPVAAIPARDVIGVADRGDSVGLAALRDAVDAVWPNGEHLLTRELLARNPDGSWTPFDPTGPTAAPEPTPPPAPPSPAPPASRSDRRTAPPFGDDDSGSRGGFFRRRRNGG